MKLSKCFKHALSMVLHSKLRSWLTILGIVIGVASVIAIMSMSTGMQESMGDQLGNLGGDILTITSGYSRGSGMMGPGGGDFRGATSVATEEEVVLDWSDYQTLKGVPGIELMDTQIRGNVKTSYLGKSGTVSLTGVDQKTWPQITTIELASGRFLDSADQNVVVIGGSLADDFFDQPLGINKMITIEGTAFRIVGVTDEERSTTIYMPIQMAYNILADSEYGVYDSIIVKVRDENKLNDTITAIESKLKMIRHVTDKTKDFTVTSNKQMQETRSAMMSTMNSFLLAIASVSLIVGAVGVANSMFTSVLEKTKQIGIMKAIGARNHDILMIFLLNAGLIGLVGGLIGAFFGTLLSGLLPMLMSGVRIVGRETIVSWQSLVVALAGSVLIGIISGIVPAYQASKLKPVDALRYE